jgi:O-glycosyl hydrolase
MAVKALKCGYSSFTGWNLMLDEMGGPNVGPFIGICGGLVTRDSRSGELTYSGQYRAFTQITRYVNPKSKIYPLLLTDTFNLRIASYPNYNREIEGVIIDNGNRKVAVIVNPNDNGIQAQLELSGKLWYIELHGDSISTVIIE